MTAIALWHHGLTVEDLDRSIDFYTKVLGFSVRHRQVQENEYTSNMLGHQDVRISVAQLVLDGAPVGDSGHLIELIEWQRPPGRRAELRDFPDISTAHLALGVRDLDVIIERAAEFGSRPHSEVQDITAGINRGGRVVFLRDPDGAWLELLEPPVRPGQPQPGGEQEPPQ